jgi:hypothetical protein
MSVRYAAWSAIVRQTAAMSVWLSFFDFPRLRGVAVVVCSVVCSWEFGVR